MNAKIIGEHIKEYRKRNNISQREMAEMLFVSDKTVSRWELGNGLPDIELLPKIAEILGISIDQLVGSEDMVDGDKKDSAIKLYKEETERLEAQLHEKEREIEIKQARIKKIAFITAITVFCLLIIVLSVAMLVKPRYTLTLVDATTENGKVIVELKSGEGLPKISANGKTVLGFIDEGYNFYTIENFVMPDRNLTLRALIKEDMPLFAGSDGNMNGERVAEHVMTDEGIPATKYTFASGSLTGSYIQSRPVSDSGEMDGINVYAPSLGERFFLLSVQNTGDSDVKIRYRIENFGDNPGGFDYYTPSVLLKANSVTYIPIYFNNLSGFGVFEGCDHFVVLDQDIEEQVELVVFGYIYTAEELAGISIVKAPDKFIYKEGELIDLSGMIVRADLVRESTTGSVRIYNFECDAVGKAWTEGMNSVTVSFAGKTAEVVINNPFQYKIAFTPAKNLESINGTSGSDYISARYTQGLYGMTATQFSFSPGATAGMEVEAWINQEIQSTNDMGINLRIPTFSGSERYLELIVTNHGGEEISFYYYAENYGDRGGVNITVAPGETKTVDFKVNPGSSPGCNYAFKLLSDVSVETTLTMQGYFYCRDELEGIQIYKEPEKKSFAVGDLFDTEGLVVKALGENYGDVIIANFTTSLDGYVFTKEDCGTKTVTVQFDRYTVTYEIEIVQ